MTVRRSSWVGIVVAGIAVWANTLDNRFHFDDFHSIVDNLHVRSLESIPSFFTDPSTFSVDADKGMFRPLLVTSFALNFAGGGLEVGGYHAVNVAVHVVNALLVWWLAGLLGAGVRGRLLAGLMFVVHPVGSEPVNYISSRSESLAATFYLLGLCLYARAGQDEEGAPEGSALGFRAGAWASLAAGLLTKSTVLTLVGVFLALDLLVLGAWDVRRLGRRLLTHHAPGWLVAAGYLLTVTANGWLTRSLAQEVRAPREQLLTQLKALGYYLNLVAVPTHLSVEPQFFVQARLSAAVAVPLLLAATVAWGGVWLWRRGSRRGLFLLVWLALYVLPTVVKPLNVLVNERRAYVPLVIACVAAGVFLVPALRGLRAGTGLAVAAVLVLGLLSMQRNQVWADDFRLWGDAVHKAPRMARAHLYLGNAHKDAALRATDAVRRRRHWRAASASFERSHVLARDPDLTVRALNNRGGVHFALGQDFAVQGDTVRALEEYARAAEIWRQALAHNPRFADALINLGSTSLTRARYAAGLSDGERRLLTEESAEYYRRALEVRPNHFQGHGNLGVALEDLGRLEGSEAHYRRAIFLKPDDWTTLKNLANLLRRLAIDAPDSVARARLAESLGLIRRALQLNPAVPGGREVLEGVQAQLRARTGR